MDTKAHPGKGLSLSQLIFALNEELKRTAYSPSFTLDEVSKFNRDASAALATIREWKNSFVSINRVPLDVISLIPSHLPSQNDRFRATFVCRHWRRTFLQNATLWSHLCLSKGETYVETILKRTKSCPLSVLASGVDPAGTVVLLPPHTKRIMDLEFTNNRWVDIQRFSEITSGPLPLLRTLNINAIWGIDPNNPDTLHPLFSGAVGLKELCLHSEVPPFLNRFVFPNLTSFDLSVTSGERFCGSKLLDFLEASPMLQAVDVKIDTGLSLGGVPRDRVVILQHVESFCLTANDGGPGYKLATHISCPSVKKTLLTYTSEGRPYNVPPPETFPASDLLNAIIHQYTRSPIKGVKLDITDLYDFIAWYLTFQSTDMTIIEFCFHIDRDYSIPESFSGEIFSKACETIRGLPLLANVKHLHIDGLGVESESITQIAHDVGGLLKSLGPLEELTICDCNMQPWFLYYPEIVGYPPIRVLTLTDLSDTLEGDATRGLLKLAKSQHELGMPLERVTVHSYGSLADLEELLRPWVGAVDCVLYDEF